MTTLSDRNLAALDANDKALAELTARATLPTDCRIIKARSGAPTAVVRGVTLHSRFDPRAEARSFADKAKADADGRDLAIFGWGLGYHILECADRVAKLLVIEPDPGMLRLAFGLLDFTAVLPGVIFLTPGSGLPNGAFLWLAAHGPSVRLRRSEYELWSAMLNPASASPDLPESAGDLKQRLGALPGASRMLDGLDDDRPMTGKDLIEAVESQGGPLAPAAIYALILRELTATGR